MKSPYTTKIERGAYSSIVRKEDDLIIAEDDVGNVVKEGSNAATVLQAAIDSCDKEGKVILADRFDIDAELVLPSLGYTSFASGITLQGYGNKTGLNYTPATGYALKLQGTADGVQCCFHSLDNFLITAPSTTDAAIGMLGGVYHAMLSGIRINNCPSGKGIYVTNHATYGNNIVKLDNIILYGCKYGLYALGGPVISIANSKFTTGIHSGVPTALEALYYSVTGYTGSGFKQLHTVNLELHSRNTDQRLLYIKGDGWFFGSHHNLYLDESPTFYLDSGRHAFHGCLLGKMEWSIGTQITVDQTSRNVWTETKDPMFGLDELQTPFRIHSNSGFVDTTGTDDVTDVDASNGKCIELDANGELLVVFYHVASTRMNKFIGLGKYLLTVYAKDTNQVTDDLKVYIRATEGGGHDVDVKNYTLQSGYNAIAYSFTLNSADVGDAIAINMEKATATANTISIDYVTLQHIGTNFHQSLGGGHQFLYLPDADTLPAASAAFRGILAFQPGAAGVGDILKMCMKNWLNNYSWKDVVTG